MRILPPKRLYHPVLPCRSNGKLKFPLCDHCATTENQSSCQCPNAARSIVGTWCIPEIQKAIQRGYTLEKIYEVYHWDTTSQYDPSVPGSGLFSAFINKFLKLKQEVLYRIWVYTVQYLHQMFFFVFFVPDLKHNTTFI